MTRKKDLLKVLEEAIKAKEFIEDFLENLNYYGRIVRDDNGKDLYYFLANKKGIALKFYFEKGKKTND